MLLGSIYLNEMEKFPHQDFVHAVCWGSYPLGLRAVVIARIGRFPLLYHAGSHPPELLYQSSPTRVTFPPFYTWMLIISRLLTVISPRNALPLLRSNMTSTFLFGEKCDKKKVSASKSRCFSMARLLSEGRASQHSRRLCTFTFPLIEHLNKAQCVGCTHLPSMDLVPTPHI